MTEHHQPTTATRPLPASKPPNDDYLRKLGQALTHEPDSSASSGSSSPSSASRSAGRCW